MKKPPPEQQAVGMGRLGPLRAAVVFESRGASSKGLRTTPTFRPIVFPARILLYLGNVCVWHLIFGAFEWCALHSDPCHLRGA